MRFESLGLDSLCWHPCFLHPPLYHLHLLWLLLLAVLSWLLSLLLLLSERIKYREVLVLSKIDYI